MTNKFSRTQSRILCYGKERNYAVIECNCLEDVEEMISIWGKPHLYMDNFNTWQEMAKAKRCYEWLVSGLPGAKRVDSPTDVENDWFWEKQLVHEHFVKDIKEIVAKWDNCLPDSPDRYPVKFEK